MKTRDQAEFKRIYDRYFDDLYRYVFLHVKQQEDSADIVQEIFYKFYLSAKVFHDDEHIKAWLLRCAYHASIDHFRAKSYHDVTLDELKTASLPFEIDETLAVLLQMPAKYQDPIYMYYYEGYSTEEIAKILKKPHATVRTQLKRGRELLKDHLS